MNEFNEHSIDHINHDVDSISSQQTSTHSQDFTLTSPSTISKKIKKFFKDIIKQSFPIATEVWVAGDSVTTSVDPMQGIMSHINNGKWKGIPLFLEVSIIVNTLGLFIASFEALHKRKKYNSALKKYEKDPTQIKYTKNDLPGKTSLNFKSFEFVSGIYKAFLAILAFIATIVKIVASLGKTWPGPFIAKISTSAVGLIGAIFVALLTILGIVSLNKTARKLKNVKITEKHLLSDLRKLNANTSYFKPIHLKNYLRNEWVYTHSNSAYENIIIAQSQHEKLTALELKNFLDFKDAYLTLSKWLTSHGIKEKWIKIFENLLSSKLSVNQRASIQEELFQEIIQQSKVKAKNITLEDLNDFIEFSKKYQQEEQRICSKLTLMEINTVLHGHVLCTEQKVKREGKERLNDLCNFIYNRKEKLHHTLVSKTLRAVATGLGFLLAAGIVALLFKFLGLSILAGMIVGAVITGLTNIVFYLIEKIGNTSLPWNKPKIEREKNTYSSDAMITYLLAQEEIESKKTRPLNPLNFSEPLPERKLTKFGVKMQYAKHQLLMRDQIREISQAIPIIPPVIHTYDSAPLDDEGAPKKKNDQKISNFEGISKAHKESQHSYLASESVNETKKYHFKSKYENTICTIFSPKEYIQQLKREARAQSRDHNCSTESLQASVENQEKRISALEGNIHPADNEIDRIPLDKGSLLVTKIEPVERTIKWTVVC